MALVSTSGNEVLLQALIKLGRDMTPPDEAMEESEDLDELRYWQFCEKRAKALIINGSLSQLLPISGALLQLNGSESSCFIWP